jgi:cytidylate kinase
VIAIDGPSGAGKSTLARALARRLGYLYLDSGAVYRAVALRALLEGVPLDDPIALAQIARRSEIKLEGDPDHLRVLLDGRDVTERIRMPDCDRAASIVAAVPEVRQAVIEKLRQMSESSCVVMDGRDIGTKVFPEAQVKLFVDASPEVRAERRWKQELERGRARSLSEVRASLEERDRRDAQRSATPLMKAEDAILIETSDMTLDQVIERALEIVNSAKA